MIAIRDLTGVTLASEDIDDHDEHDDTDDHDRFTYLYLHKITQTGFKSQVPKTEFSRENPKKLKY